MTAEAPHPPAPFASCSRTALRAGRGKGDESVGGVHPPTGPGLRKRAEEPNTGRRPGGGAGWGRAPSKNRTPPRAGGGGGGPPPPAPPVSRLTNVHTQYS